MSEYNIPFHIQEEIMKRLPVKPLIQFRSVSKAWKSLIDNSEFIVAHCLHRHAQPQHLLVSLRNHEEVKDCAFFCRSYIDDDTFPHQRSILTLPPSVKGLKIVNVVGSSHGLLCLYASFFYATRRMIVILNPSIRKSFVVDVPNDCSYGFGVCPVTGDPKIVVITQHVDYKNYETSHRCEVMVYTLSSGKWRSLSTNLHTFPLRYLLSSAVTDGFIYWRVDSPKHPLILSFDVTNESLEVIDIPDIFVCDDLCELYASNIPDSLTILEYRGDISTVWMMEHGVQKLFTKQFTIKVPHGYIVGFRKNGVPIMRVRDGGDDDDGPPKLVVYEPNSEHNNVLEIGESSNFFTVNSYMETLLLHGRSDCSSY